MNVLKWFLAAAVVFGTATAANAQLTIDGGDIDVMVAPHTVHTVPFGTTIELPAVTTERVFTQAGVVGCPTAVSTCPVACPTAVTTDACGNVITHSAVIEDDDDMGFLGILNPLNWLDAIFD